MRGTRAASLQSLFDMDANKTSISKIKANLGPLKRLLGDHGHEVNSGGMFRCILPGHEDRNPSASIFAAEERWYCFVCGRGGDVIDAAAAFAGRSTSEYLRQYEFAPEDAPGPDRGWSVSGRLKWD